MDAYRADMHDQIVHKATNVTADILDRLAREYENLPVRDLPGAARNTETVAGIASDKSANLRARALDPAAPMRSAAEIVRSLQATGFDPGKLRFTQTQTIEVDPESDRPDAIEGTATEQPSE